MAGVAAVAAREVAWLRRDFVARLLVLYLPLIVIGALTIIFSNGVIRNLHIDVVDADRTAISDGLVQTVDASPNIRITSRATDLTSAMHAIRSGEAIASVFILENFQRDLLAGRRPQVIGFYNKQFFTPGNVANSAIQSAVSAFAAALPKASSGSHSYAPGTLVPQQYALNNPELNYAQFLLRAVIPTVLHVLIGITGAFSVGSEFGPKRNIREWLQTAGGSPLKALVGKLLPYLGIFILMLVVDLFVVHGFFRIQFRGVPYIVAAGAILMTIAYLLMGAFFTLLTKQLPLGLSLTGMVCSPAFGFAGVGFPTIGMEGFAHVWGSLLPLRWYIQILFDQAARDVPMRDSLVPLSILFTLASALFVLSWLRAAAVLRNPPQHTSTPAPEPIIGRLTIFRAFKEEYGRVLRDVGAFGLFVIAPTLYAAYYPQPYVGQLVRNVPIAVVDDDNTELSRAIIQNLNADEALRVARRPLNLSDAQAEIARREVFGVVSIPAGTERDYLKGNSARIPVYADSAYFLLYNRTAGGISEAIAAVGTDYQAGPARSDGSLYHAAVSRAAPVEFVSTPLFNPTGGYLSYVVPAALILILQQTLLMGVATLGGVNTSQRGQEARLQRGEPAAIIGQSLAHFALVLPFYLLYLFVLPRIYGYASTDHYVDLLAIVVPFIFAVSLLGQFVGAIVKRRETAVIVMMGLGLPLFFMVGVSWPVDAMPQIARVIASAIPSTFGIDGIVRVNQMGASIGDVSHDCIRLWVMALVYGTLAFIATRRFSFAEAPP
ncbi:ABC transporter permease [Methylovirgula sp. 4M-Z18]|uniref:ABC transporter permease n=1 Tax=Methylovirgula sp. 4M-Z18 TaxID=2293567 RepID=UPI000E2E7B8B|nr:ABC transporter permease [Methylovirgula sp. 4M-Z18]RFB80929.1 ABC transporter permease [Methylovirgula sp. 4M-Z18]